MNTPSVAYGFENYLESRKDSESFAPKGDEEVFEWIGNWKETPPEEVVNQDYAWWHMTEVYFYLIVLYPDIDLYYLAPRTLG